MAKRVSEIFGYVYGDQSPAAVSARNSHTCPFTGTRCIKQSRLLAYPMGACSAHYQDDVIALCPNRFLENRTVFRDIAIQEFGTSSDVLVFSEVGLTQVGNFDFVLVHHANLSSQILDFTLVEFQTGQTTSTGGLVKSLDDAMNDRLDVSNDYKFGMNHYDIWKRTFTQIINKGVVAEAWQKNIYWVVQKPIYDYFIKRYRLTNVSQGTTERTIFSVYDMPKSSPSGYSLQHLFWSSASVDAMIDAFRNNAVVPDMSDFISTLSEKIRAGVGFSFDS
jgi:hypothetical protein